LESEGRYLYLHVFIGAQQTKAPLWHSSITMSLPSSRSVIPFFVLTGLVSAGISHVLRMSQIADIILLVTLSIGSIPLLIDIIRSIAHKHFGVDIIAIVAIVASLLLHQYLAGTVILLMLSGGEALEGYALRRARKELTDLIARAPTKAHKEESGHILDVSIESVQPGDIIIVKTGEIIPVDGTIIEGTCMVDESMLTGESIPVRKTMRHNVMSGSVAKDGVLKIKATHESSDSKYQRIIRLISDAEQQKAPFVRLADRYSVVFTSVTFILAIGAWIVSGDPVRSLAVLVVATPCPLILATPIAFASGISRAAKRGIIVKNGGVLEKLGMAKSFIFDKTGTLTFGTPSITLVKGYGENKDVVFERAASVDQLSAHILARALVQEATARNLPLSYPEQFEERIGDGVQGVIEGKKYLFGRLSFLKAEGATISDEMMHDHDEAQHSGQMTVFLAEDARIIGSICFADTIRDNVQQLFRNLSALGIERVMMLTGDKKASALRIAKEIGIKEKDVEAEMLPEDKVNAVLRLRASMSPVIMVGDGVNDAPAIAAADVGIAMGGHGNTASSEAGDIVILIDRLERVGEALSIGHRVLQIAKESIFIGMGLSILLMIIASMGYIVPVYGALLQEVVDVIVILNALRVLFISADGVTTESA
jgi:heavy metal translocating P-type ATPase